MAVLVERCTSLVGVGVFSSFGPDLGVAYHTARLLSVRTHHGGQISDCIISSKQITWRWLAKGDRGGRLSCILRGLFLPVVGISFFDP